jgi:hypothetical protein
MVRHMITVCILILSGWQLICVREEPVRCRKPARCPADPGSSNQQITGMFTYLADAAVITLCADGRQLPVAMEKDYIALERAYLQADTPPGHPVLVSVEGLITLRPSMEETQPPGPRWWWSGSSLSGPMRPAAVPRQTSPCAAPAGIWCTWVPPLCQRSQTRNRPIWCLMRIPCVSPEAAAATVLPEALRSTENVCVSAPWHRPGWPVPAAWTWSGSFGDAGVCGQVRHPGSVSLSSGCLRHGDRGVRARCSVMEMRDGKDRNYETTCYIFRYG